MEIQLSNRQFIIRPSSKRGIEIQVLAHNALRISLLLEIYETPCLEINIPFFTLYVGWYNREMDEKMEKFFHIE